MRDTIIFARIIETLLKPTTDLGLLIIAGHNGDASNAHLVPTVWLGIHAEEAQIV